MRDGLQRIEKKHTIFPEHPVCNIVFSKEDYQRQDQKDPQMRAWSEPEDGVREMVIYGDAPYLKTFF